MCSVIGFVTNNYNEEQNLLLIELFKQSQIRGKHATGLSYFDKTGQVYTLLAPIHANEFIKEIEEFNFIDQKDLFLIGHTRYSTSDLEYNQPIHFDGISIVHNGVITQEFSNKWKEHFGYDCETKNDSELILRCIKNNEHPLIKFKGSSIAAIVLQNEEIKFFRNGNRPLWYLEYNGSYFISSTKDILQRTFKNVLNEYIEPIKCENGIEYKIDSIFRFSKSFINIDSDQQIDLECSNYYKKVQL